jgi:parallel beta-helix repeat protein
MILVSTHSPEYFLISRKYCFASVLLVLMFILMMQVQTLSAATYYIDATNGDDYNPGTLEEPWKTSWRTNWMNHAIHLEPGDTVLFKRGETWNEVIWVTTKGTLENPITYGAYGDENDPLPIFDGTFAGTVEWQHVEGNIYKTETQTWQQNKGPRDPGIIIYDGAAKPSIATLAIDTSTPVTAVRVGAVLLQRGGGYCNLWVTSVDEVNNTVSGISFFRNPTHHWVGGARIEVRQLGAGDIEEKFDLQLPETGGLSVSLSSLQQSGQWYWDAAEQALYLYSETDPATFPVEVGRLKYGIQTNQMEHIKFQDLTLRGFTDAGAYFSMSQGMSLDNIHVSQIGASGHKTGILFSNTHDSIVKNSVVDSVLVNGICVYAMSPDYQVYHSKNNHIENNTITGTGSAGIMLNTDFMMQAVNVANTTVTGNIIEDANALSYDAAGIYLLNVGNGNQLVGNTIRNGGSNMLRSGGIMVDGGVKPIIISGNTIENNSLGGIAVSGEGHQITNNMLHYNGVPSWESAQIVFFSAMANATGCTVTGNSMKAGADQMLFMVLNGKPDFADPLHTIDNNIYETSAPSQFCWNKKYVCEEPSDFATWQCSSGNLVDENSTVDGVDPEDPLQCGEPPEEEIPCEQVPPPESTTTYYVDATGGNDNNSGTSAEQAWKSLRQVNAAGGRFGAGDSILFKRGESWHDKIWFRSSGERCYPIEFGAYGDEEEPLPLIDGSYSGFPVPLQWQRVEGDIYRTLQPTWNNDPGILIYKGTGKPAISTLSFDFSTPVDGVKIGAVLLQTVGAYCNLWVTSVDTTANTISGITFFRTPTTHWVVQTPVEVRQLDATGKEEKFTLTLASPGGLSVTAVQDLTQPGHWYWNASEKAIYLFSFIDPATVTVEPGQQRWGFVSQFQEYLDIHDLSFRGAKEVGTYFFGCKGITIDNITVSDIGANGHHSGILFHNTQKSTANNSTVDSALVNGIVSFAKSPGSEWNCNFNTFSGNQVLNSGAAGIMLAAETIMQAGYINDNTVSGNTIEGANTLSYDSAGIYLVNVNSGNQLSDNMVSNGGSAELRSAGIMIDSAVPAVTIQENTVENNSLAGVAVTGSGHTITNNNIMNNGVPSWESAQLIFFTVHKNASGCEVKENTLTAGEDQALFLVLDGKPTMNDDPHDIDFNTYSSPSLTSFCWDNKYTCEQSVDFESWKLIPDIDGDNVVDQAHDDNSTFTSAGSGAGDTTIMGSDIPGVDQSRMPEDDKSRLYIELEVPGPDGIMYHCYVPEEYALELTEMDIIDESRNIEAMISDTASNGVGYIISIGLRHPEIGDNMYITLPKAELLGEESFSLLYQGPGETVWQSDLQSEIVGSFPDTLLVRVNSIGLFAAAHMTVAQDNDGDGYTVAQADCNDNNPDIYPGATEICGNQTDDNCNDQIDENCVTLNTVFMNGLEWQKAGNPGQFRRSQATAYCSTFAGEGNPGWRLPTKEELKGLVVCTNGAATPLPDGTTCGTGYRFPTINPLFSCHNSSFWTATEEGTEGWTVSFYTGESLLVNSSTATANVRCVRTVQ